MFASPSLLAASSLLLAATAFADDSSAYSKFLSDANSVLAAATGTDAAQLDAIYSWQATQTAVPNADIESQYQDYLNAYMTASSAPIPTWVAALPTSLQPVMTSFLEAEATLVRQDIAPMVSEYNEEFDEDVSAYSATAQATPAPTSSASSASSSLSATSAPTTTASSGFAQVTANGSAARISSGMMPSANGTGSLSTTSNGTAGGPPTNTVTPPATAPQGGADRPAGVAGLAAVVGVLGMIVLL